MALKSPAELVINDVDHPGVCRAGRIVAWDDLFANRAEEIRLSDGKESIR